MLELENENDSVSINIGVNQINSKTNIQVGNFQAEIRQVKDYESVLGKRGIKKSSLDEEMSERPLQKSIKID